MSPTRPLDHGRVASQRMASSPSVADRETRVRGGSRGPGSR